MAISFPLNPTLNQTYTYNSITWTYNGTAWTKASASGGGASITVSTTAPASPTAGSTWLKDDTGDLYVYGSGGWVLTSSGGFTGSYNDLINKPTIPTVSAAAVSDQINTSTGYIGLPVGTTAQRPATPATGSTRINSTTNTFEVYYNNMWSTIATVGWVPQTQINTSSMAHNIVNPGGTGLQGQGSSVITTYGAAALSVAPGSVSYTSTNFSSHGGHSGSNGYPMYWAVHLGTPKAVNQLVTYVHVHSWGHFVLEGSNDSGSTGNFATNGTWTPITFANSNNGSNTQNMGGNGSGRGDGTTIICNYTNNVGYSAYRVKILDSSAPSQAIGTTYTGSAGYSWQLNRV